MLDARNNSTDSSVRKLVDLDLVSRFEEMVGAHAENVAIIASGPGPNSVDSLVSYQALNERRLEIASALIDQYDVQPGDRVGLFQSQQIDTLAAMLGIATIGASYVPLDPELPPARLNYICNDSATKVMLTAAAEHPDDVVSLSSLRGEPRSHDSVNGESPLYVMYTSGSTGLPKGVIVPHRAVCRLVIETNFMSLDQHTRFLQLAPQSFDAATLEIWGPLLNGGVCILYPDEIVDPETLKTVIKTSQVNSMWLTAALFNQFVAQWPDAFEGLETLLFGGERASVPHVRHAFQLLPNTRLINGYGPTENTTFTCCHRVVASDVAENSLEIPIGQPITGTSTRIVDENLAEVSEGGTGELLTGGLGLAIGYLNQDELTAERFITDENGSRWYRTGDLARRSEDGIIHYLGRIDRQLKLHGHRIEPGEVEVAIMQTQTIRSVYVLAVETPDKDQKLVAYVVGEFDKPSLRRKLAVDLPRYMVPSVYISINKLPTTANGKIDVAALPDPFQQQEFEIDSGMDSDMLSVVAAIWKEVVSGIELTSNDDNFFDVGGTSMDMLHVKEKLDGRLHRDVPLVTLFQYPTVTKLATYLAADEDNRPAEKNIKDRALQRREQLSLRREKRSRN